MVPRNRLVLAAALLLGLGAPIGVAQTITEFPVGNSGIPYRIAPGPDGALWFTTFGDAVARITTAGVVTYFDFPGVWRAVDITTGPDGNLWFTTGNPDDAFPNDLTNFRMNIGVRTLDAPVLMTVTVRNAVGTIAATVPKFFQATYHEQLTATAFLNGLPLPPGGSITATVEAGNAIVYGATVDNRTGDPSLQIAAPAP